ncbi:hypothetical protein JTB14_037033 [Gonioctena quinquepunctata]|nr:hypothetical protein JTB14_037033 [Gonioctena quinquepunctata]
MEKYVRDFETQNIKTEVLSNFEQCNEVMKSNRKVLNVVHHIDSDNVRYSHIYDLNGETFLILETVRSRNKRVTTYLTLCPFKICNMGRKRTRTKRSVNKIGKSVDIRYSS